MIYDVALQNLLKKEGGLARVSGDRGGDTIHGVSSKYFPQDFKALQELTAQGDDDAVNAYLNQFYKKNFWEPIGADKMNPQMAQVAFDTAVNHGVPAAQEMLQNAGGDPSKVLQQREQKYVQLAQNDPTQMKFLNGWNNRIDALADETGVMNDATPELPPGFTLIEDDQIVPENEDDKTWSRFGNNLINQSFQGATSRFGEGLIYGLDRLTGVPKNEALENLDFYRSALEKDREAYPVSSFIAEAAGSIPSAMGVGGVAKAIAPQAVKAAGAFAAARPGTAATLLGAGGNALYGQGARDGGPQTLLDNTVIDAGVGGILGFLGHRAVNSAGQFISSLRKSPEEAVAAAGGLLGDAGLAQKATDDVAQAAVDAANLTGNPQLTPLTAAGILDDQALARMEKGNVIPLTAGQKSQNVVTQRMEQKALMEGNPTMKMAVSKQQTEAYKPFVGLLGDAQELQKEALQGRSASEIERAAGILRQKYDEMGEKVSKAYQIADEMGGVEISGPALRDDLLGKIDETLASEDYMKGDLPALDRELKNLKDRIFSEVTDGEDVEIVLNDTTIGKLEAWKKNRLNKLIDNTPFDQKATKRMLTNISRVYDDFLTNLADDAIIAGDNKAIDAFKNARSLASQRFKFRDSDAVVGRILENRELTGEGLVNLVMGSAKLANKGDSGTVIGKMISLSGDKAPEMQDAMRKGVMARVLKNSVTNTIDANDQTRAILSWQKMRSSIGDLMTNNKEMFQTLFDDKEQEYWKMMHKDLIKLGSQQHGSYNNSSSGAFIADTLLNMGKVINNPLFRTATAGITTPVEKYLQMQAQATIDRKVESGLSDILNDAIKHYSTPAIFWGGGLGGTFGQEGAGAIGSSLYKNEYIDENTQEGAQ